VPSRHLGLVQAGDLPDLDPLLEMAAETIAAHVDTSSLLAAATPLAEAGDAEAMPPPHSHIAIAHDAAFGFAYQHLLDGWLRQGAKLDFFSPLADETPAAGSGFIFLPGGYPELHLDKLVHSRLLFESLKDAAADHIPVYGECGGYMVLGKAIIDSGGSRVEMAGLLDLETSFASPKRHLGYRQMENIGTSALPEKMRGHEFHYTRAIHENGTPLFNASDRDGHDLGACGLISGSVAGSYLHMIAAVSG